MLNVVKSSRLQRKWFKKVSLLLVFLIGLSEAVIAQTHPPKLVSLVNDDVSRTKVNALREHYTQLIAAELGVSYTTAYCPPKRCYSNLYDGSGDILMFVNSIAVETDRVSAIGEFAGQKNTLVVFLRKGEEGKVTQFTDLEGMRVGTLLGLPYGSQFSKNTKIKKYAVSKTSQLNKMLMAGRIDAYVTFRTTGGEIEDYPYVSRTEVPYEQGAFSIALVSRSSPYHEKLKAILPGLFERWTTSGYFEKSCQKIVGRCPEFFGKGAKL